MGLAGFAMEAALVEPHRPVVERVEVVLRRLPRELDGLTIAHLSDFHYDSAASAGVIRTAVEITHRLAPDVVVLTGDYVTLSPFQSRSRAAEHSKPCAQLLGDLHAPMGVFGVLGNHDYATEPRLVTRSLEAHGITVLRNFNLRIERSGARLWIAGVDDVLGGGARLDQALQGIPRDEATVLLAHEPDYADTVISSAVDLQLSGHSHGGQVRLPLVGAPFLPYLARKYPWGLRQLDRLKLYTNRGVGTIFPPVRFNCPPEVTLLTLRAGSADARIASGLGESAKQSDCFL
jgi:predicted MPP superfamily phosphohydrolase